MRFAKYLGAVAALSMSTAPALANPAASLSVAKSVRASTPTKNANELHGAGVFLAAAAAIGVVVAIVLIADDNKSKSK